MMDSSYSLLVLIFISEFAFIPILSQVESNCDYRQVISPGQSYYVYNPEYPNFSTGQNLCRWFALSEFGYTISMNCDVDMPTSVQCQEDALLISETEDPSFQYAQRYCGRGNFRLTSQFFTIGSVSTAQSNGSRFLCELTAVPAECDCGWALSPRIVGGEETQANELPFMAGVVDATQRRLICGASIITEKFVLTAAHCVQSLNPEYILIVVGEHDVTAGQDSNYTSISRVTNVIIHENYSGSFQDDIALLETSTQIVWSAAVGPICLPFLNSYDSFAGTEVEIAGWGAVVFKSGGSDVLRKATTQVLSNNQCQDMSNSTIASSLLCTYKNGTDACQMDSGGPVYLRGSRIFLVGIISSGMECNNLGYNDRVTSYLDWIAENSNASFCQKSIVLI